MYYGVNINTAEQFKTDGVTERLDKDRQLIHNTRGTVTLHPDLSRGVTDVNPNSVSVPPQAVHNRFHLIHLTTLVLA